MPGTGAANTAPHVRVGPISVTLEPSFLLVTAAIGLVSGTAEGFFAWVVAVSVSILVHELGHAVTFVAMGSAADIRLYALGGLTSGRVVGPRWRRVAVFLAGPVAGIVLLGVPAWLIKDAVTPPPGFTELLLAYTVWASLGWSLVNLLPLQHLDGGQIARSLLEVPLGDRAKVVAPVLSLVTAGTCAVVAFSLGQPFLAVYALFFVALSWSAVTDAIAAPAKQELYEIHRAIDDGRLPEATARADRLASPRRPAAVVRDAAELPAWIAVRRGDRAAADAALAGLPPGVTPSAYLRAAVAAVAGRRDEAIDLAITGYQIEPRWPPNRQLARAVADAGAVPGLVTALAGAGFANRIGALDDLQGDLHYEGRYSEALIVGRRAMELEPSGQIGSAHV